MCAGHHGESVTYGGLTIHKPERWQVMWGEGLAGLMWCAADSTSCRARAHYCLVRYTSA